VGVTPGCHTRGVGPGSTEAVILHVDLDAFFAAVEVLDRPELAGRPVVVGGTGARGVVAAASYEARTYGIASAMPMARARRLCPAAVVLPGRFARYQALSRRFLAILGRYTPLVEPVALDEAFLDVTGSGRLLGDGPTIARAIRAEVATELGLGASVGVATTKMVAKLASEAAKPRAGPRGPVPGPGVVVVAPGGELGFLHPRPVRALWGVGPATERRLAALGVRTVGDLAHLPVEALVAALGRAHGRHLHDLATGRDHRAVEGSRVARSLGHERTFPVDHRDRGVLATELMALGDAVAQRLRAEGLVARTVALKVRYADFRTISRAVTPPEPVGERRALVAAARGLLEAVDVDPGLRLLGLSARTLRAGAAGAVQLRLAEPGLPGDGGRSGVATAVDAVRARFGPSAVGPASLLGPGGMRVRRPGDGQWGPDG